MVFWRSRSGRYIPFAGRITEYLAPLLKAFGSDIAIATSSSVKKAKIKMHGFKAVDI